MFLRTELHHMDRIGKKGFLEKYGAGKNQTYHEKSVCCASLTVLKTLTQIS